MASEFDKFFTPEMAQGLPDDPVLAAQSLFETHISLMNSNGTNWEKQPAIVRAYAMIAGFLRAHGITHTDAQFTGNPDEDIGQAHKAIVAMRGRWNERYKVDAAADFESLFSAKYKTGDRYQFDENDLESIQRLLNILRGQIEASELSDDHKERLLRRLAELQRELHKKVSSLDKFYGFVMDAGFVLGRFGKDSHLFGKTVKELLEIVLSSNARKAGLPKGSKLPLLDLKDQD